jgi:hypothetical protein
MEELLGNLKLQKNFQNYLRTIRVIFYIVYKQLSFINFWSIKNLNQNFIQLVFNEMPLSKFSDTHTHTYTHTHTHTHTHTQILRNIDKNHPHMFSMR